MVKIVMALLVGLYIPLIDFIDLVIKLIFRARNSHEGDLNLPTSVREITYLHLKTQYSFMLKPYKILVAVHNISKAFEEFKKNIAFFGYDNVLVIDDMSTDETAILLEKEGIPFFTNKKNCQKPNSILSGLKKLPENIETVIVMDPDSMVLNLNSKEFNKTKSDFEEVLCDFQNSLYDACAVRVLAHCESILEYLQNFEYKISMSLTKKSMGGFSVISGAFAIFKRSFLQSVLCEHSLSVYGEDYETSLRILTRGGQIYYDGRLTILTKQRKTLSSLTRQRMGWDLSLFKINFMMMKEFKSLPKKVLSYYEYIYYNILISVILHPFRILSIFVVMLSFLNFFDNLLHIRLISDNYFTNPNLFPLFYIFCMFITYSLLISIEKRRRNKYYFVLLLFPFYSLYMGLIPRTLGFLNFIFLKIFGVKLIEDGYKYA